jgi:glycosyltransferase involved in cell wall biosynthesis
VAVGVIGLFFLSCLSDLFCQLRLFRQCRCIAQTYGFGCGARILGYFRIFSGRHGRAGMVRNERKARVFGDVRRNVRHGVRKPKRARNESIMSQRYELGMHQSAIQLHRTFSRTRKVAFPAPRPPTHDLRDGKLSVVIPYYNEAAYIGETLRSLLTQSRPPDQIILVDNASVDGSEAVCRATLAGSPHPSVLFLREARPGKVHALETACARVDCEYTALCDADIAYPPHYLALAEELFASEPPDTVAVMGQVVERSPVEFPEVAAKLRRTVFWSRVLTGKCLTGGAGQIFRTRALRRAGGFSAARWNYVLLDHEIMNRMRRQGRSLYHADLWVLHSDRRKDRGGVRWGLFDRLLYRYTPDFMGDWFFHRWLAPRFERRRMTHLNLRAQPWRTQVPAEHSARA